MGNSKNIRTLVFFLVMAVFLAVPLYMIWRYETVHSKGNVFRFRSQPVDPYDAFRGKYITLYFDELQSVKYPNAKETFSSGQSVYLLVQNDDSGFAHITRVFAEPPPIHDYIEMKITSIYEDELHVLVPFETYYLNEELAPLAEQAYQEYAREEDVYVDVRVLDGKALIEELYIRDKPLVKFLREDFRKGN